MRLRHGIYENKCRISFTCKRLQGFNEQILSSFDIKPFAGVLEPIGYTTPSNYLNNRVYFLSRNYRLIVAPQQRFKGKYAIVVLKRSNFEEATIRPET